jgi:hypothetical protein
MKKINKLLINSEKLLKNNELLILRGGYGDNFSWYCMGEPTSFLGCVSTIINMESVAMSYCNWKFGTTDYVVGLLSHDSNCDVW